MCVALDAAIFNAMLCLYSTALCTVFPITLPCPGFSHVYFIALRQFTLCCFTHYRTALCLTVIILQYIACHCVMLCCVV